MQPCFEDNSRPLISVIIPNYNHGLYLRERIDSVLGQTYRPIEVIILDDASADNSSEIIFSYQHREEVVEVEINRTNSGNTFLQWEKGFSFCKGRYIWIAESDDTADPSFLEELYSCFEREKGADLALAFSGSVLINEQGDPISDNWDKDFWNDQEKSSFVTMGETFLSRYLFPSNVLYNASMVLFSRERISQVSKKYQQYRYSGDWFFWIELIGSCPVAKVGKKLNYFRQHTNKVSTKSQYQGAIFYENISLISHIESFTSIPKEKKQRFIGQIYRLSLHSKFMTKQEREALLRYLRNTYKRAVFYYWDLKLYRLGCKIKKLFNISRR